jgi:uncharacterized protein (TIGR02246 family)
VEQAISQQNIEALLDLFELDAVFVDPGSGAELRGHDQIRQAAAEMFESKPRIEGTAPPKVWISGDLALVISTWSLDATADGKQHRQEGTATDVMRRQDDGTWRYVIDNPAGIEHAQPPA